MINKTTREVLRSAVNNNKAGDNQNTRKRGSSRFSIDSTESVGTQLNLLIISFNMGHSSFSNLQNVIPMDGQQFDLIVIGLQEVSYSSVAKETPKSRPKKSAENEDQLLDANTANSSKTKRPVSQIC